MQITLHHNKQQSKFCIMKNLTIILLSMLTLFSCVTTKKAVDKVVSTEDFTPGQRNLMAAKLLIMFPPADKTEKGPVTSDSTDFKNTLEDLQTQLDQHREDYLQVLKLSEERAETNIDLSNIAARLQRRIDSTDIILQAAKSGKIPPVKQSQTNTVTPRTGPELELCQNRLAGLEGEKAALNLENARLKASEADKAAQIKGLENMPTGKFKVGLWSFLAGAGLMFIALFIIKIKKPW